MMPLNQDKLVNAMLNPGFYNHPVDQVELIQTHISWVFLTGQYAYKVKKPVNFGFLDFTLLEQRKFYCEEELRLNGRLAPETYLDVIAITESNETLALQGDGNIIEYAIKMKQFGQDCLLNHLLEHHQITTQHIDMLADKLASFHGQIAVADDSAEHGNLDRVWTPIEQNFVLLAPLIDDVNDHRLLDEIKTYSLTLYKKLTEYFIQRKSAGYIRECHGDMHTGNIALVDREILIFDGIEFNDSFRWIDTMSELAFLVMDLQDHHFDHYSNQLLNRYLELTGDYAGLAVFPYYLIYRAMVRAKVNGLQLQQQTHEQDYQLSLSAMRNYLSLAHQYTIEQRPCLIITQGISGTGKTWLSKQLANQLKAIHIRSDCERKRLFSSAHNNLYTDDISKQTYERLLTLAQQILTSGFSVIVDATFLQYHWRQQFMQLAQTTDTPFHILCCQACQQTLEQRIIKRQNDNKDLSDATIEVMQKQLNSLDPLCTDETKYAINVDTEREFDIGYLAQLIKP